MKNPSPQIRILRRRYFFTSFFVQGILFFKDSALFEKFGVEAFPNRLNIFVILLSFNVILSFDSLDRQYFFNSNKGGFISKSFYFGSNLKNGCQIPPLSIFSLSGGDLAPIFGEVCQMKKNLSHFYLNSKKQLCIMHLFDDGHNLLMLSLLISGGNFAEDFLLDDCQLLLNRSRMYWNLFFYLTIYQRHTCISFEE